jgi:hypothetical protein
MTAPLPDIPESECTPLVRQLLDIVRHLRNHIPPIFAGAQLLFIAPIFFGGLCGFPRY